jgi:transcriptional regulator with XRE-family HTH domain
MNTLGERLRHARELRGLSQAQLATMVGVSPGTIGNFEAETRKNPRKLLSIAAALRVSPHWLLHGLGSIDGQEIPTGKLLAHPLTLDARTVPPTRTRAEIMAGTDELFAFTLDDDALAPDRPRGTEFVWDRTKPPSPGSPVLVVDAHNQLHAREYRQGSAPGEWVAAAVNRAYASFPGDQVTLVAAAKYLTLP